MIAIINIGVGEGATETRCLDSREDLWLGCQACRWLADSLSQLAPSSSTSACQSGTPPPGQPLAIVRARRGRGFWPSLPTVGFL